MENRLTANSGLVFAWPVPDFIHWDRGSFFTPMPSPNRRVLSAGWAVDLARLAIVQQRRPMILLPDSALAGLVWGARHETTRWPPNWRQALARSLVAAGPPLQPIAPGYFIDRQARDCGFYGASFPDWMSGEAACSPRCPLNGRPEAGTHHHFRLQFRLDRQGSMESFEPRATWAYLERLTDDWADEDYYDFRVPKWTAAEVKKRLEAVRRILGQRDKAVATGICEDASSWWDESVGEEVSRQELERELEHLQPGQSKIPGLFAYYLPARVFGPSPKIGLTQRQCHLLSALVGETTRASGKSDRPDKALVVRVSADADVPRPAVPLPPALAAGEYVAFNGSGWGKKIWLRGYGFTIATWAGKAGFADAKAAELLADLQELAGRFELTVAGWSKDDRTWRGLDDMQGLARTKVGRDWLKGCVLRVYTAADFLARWRRYFADKLGFRCLPGGEVEPSPGIKTPGIHSAVELAQWMQEKRYSDKSLAELLGVSRTKVNLVKNGKRKWSAEFDREVNGILEVL
jgi:hypothetical protein